MHCMIMPSSNLNVETTLVQLIICISTEPCAPTMTRVWVHCGESWQQRSWCKIGISHLRSLTVWRKSSTLRLFVAHIGSRKKLTSFFSLHNLKLIMSMLLQNFSSPLNQVQSRIWLMHWSLFIFFNHDNGRTQIIDLFNQDKYVSWLVYCFSWFFVLLASRWYFISVTKKLLPFQWRWIKEIINCCRYLNAIQTNAPHLLRYLATAFIVNKRRRPQFKEFIKVIQQEQYSHEDPITEFLACIYVNYDFDGAQKKMRECEEVNFLNSKWSSFMSLMWSFEYIYVFFKLYDCAGYTEWPISWKKNWRRKLYYCTSERWISWKCPPFHLWDLLPHSSAHWYGVYACTCSFSTSRFSLFFCLVPILQKNMQSNSPSYILESNIQVIDLTLILWNACLAQFWATR